MLANAKIITHYKVRVKAKAVGIIKANCKDQTQLLTKNYHVCTFI